jgi:predicted ATP-grasp superfamily ATP-dependent carboligase
MSDPPNITSDGDDLVAEFPITYALTSSKGTSSGTLRITMHLKPQAQTWQVARIQKEVIQATMKQ